MNKNLFNNIPIRVLYNGEEGLSSPIERTKITCDLHNLIGTLLEQRWSPVVLEGRSKRFCLAKMIVLVFKRPYAKERALADFDGVQHLIAGIRIDKNQDGLLAAFPLNAGVKDKRTYVDLVKCLSKKYRASPVSWDLKILLPSIDFPFSTNSSANQDVLDLIHS